MPEFRAEWEDKPFFAEIAEALKIRTDQILAVFAPGDGALLALYTPADDPLEDPRIFRVILKREADDILVPVTEHIEVPGMWEELKRRMADFEPDADDSAP